MMNIISRFRKNTDAKRILFISTSTTSVDDDDTNDYFAAMISELAIKIQNLPDPYDFVVKVPQRGDTASDQQVNFIENAIRDPNRYECIIVSPVDRDKLYKDHLETWCKKYDRLIFVDQGFSVGEFEYFLESNAPRPSYVQANWEQGGRVAGNSMRRKLFVERKVKCPHIVLIKGLVGSSQRIKGFMEVMSGGSNNDCQPMYHECEGNYSKKSAREIFEPYLMNCIDEQRAIDGVFATNDVMALAIRDALAKNKVEYIKAFPSLAGRVPLPVVIGFDGIRDLTLHIDRFDDFIYDTVYVRLKDQIQGLANIVEKTINRTTMSAGERFINMECVSYRDLKRMGV
jgi:ABC-type sugar transport system substrate-binding protein